MDNLNQHSATYGPLTGFALKTILNLLKKDPKGWTGPEITADKGTYKLDWYAPDYEESGDYITLYDDGLAQLYVNDDITEYKITPLHFKSWIEKMRDAGVHGGMAVFAVDFFKELKKG